MLTQGRFRPATLADWRRTLRQLSLSPYVGPRPQTGEDENMLVGREPLLTSIGRRVQDVGLFVIDGDSGSGKTSLLQNGLAAQLESIGFTVLVSRRWPTPTSDDDVDLYLADRLAEEDSNRQQVDRAMIARAHPPKVGSAFFASALAEQLEQRFDGQAIVVLDQFEELLRQHPAEAERLMVWLKKVVGKPYQLRFVISLRSDSVHLLDPHLKGFPPYSLDRETVTSLLEEDDVREIIRRRRQDGRLPDVEVAPQVETAIVKAWKAATRPRLLGLQALLSSLYFTARGLAGLQPLGSNTTTGLSIDGVALSAVGEEGAELFEAGIHSFIRLALTQAEHATVACGIDPYLRYGSRELVSRTTPYLWSSGFKVPAAEDELVEKILEPELRLLASIRSPDVLPPAGRLASEMLGCSDFLNVADGPAPDGVSSHEATAGQPTVSSRNHVTAGPLLYQGSRRAVFEEARRAAFAIEWLQTTGIVRRSGDGRIELVHDGSGYGLDRWAKANRGGIDYEAHRLTAARGQHLDLGAISGRPARSSEVGRPPEVPESSGDEAGWLLRKDSRQFRVLPDLNWRDCRVTAQLTNVVFLNCDFSGARFEECLLEGVTFINCLLDDANFESCEVRGDTGIEARSRPYEPGRVRIAPSFALPVDTQMVDAFRPYASGAAEPDAETGVFFSDLAGGPAVPGTPPPDHVGQVLDPPIASGGVAFVGGRVSFLTLHSCGAPEGGKGAIEFHFVGGGGLDIVEPLDTSIVLHDCAVRGISITRDQGQSRNEPSKRGRVGFSANDSFLVYVYFSGGLHGTAEIANSVLWGVTNASGGSQGESASLGLTIEGCRYHGVVNAGAIVDSIEDSEASEPLPYFVRRPGGVSVFEARDAKALATPLDFMDYRREPEMRERQQRARWDDEGGP